MCIVHYGSVPVDLMKKLHISRVKSKWREDTYYLQLEQEGQGWLGMHSLKVTVATAYYSCKIRGPEIYWGCTQRELIGV